MNGKTNLGEVGIEREKGKLLMRRWGIVLLSALIIAILGLVFWELEYQHVSLVLWLLVAVAVLWCCAQVAVSLQVYPPTRRRRARISPKPGPRISSWMITLGGAGVLGVLGVFFWLLGFETTGQLFWFLVVVALLWGCAQLSFLLRPQRQRSSTHGVHGESPPISKSWASNKTFLERFLPGSSLQSGLYNKGNSEVWDGNESLPPYNN